MVVYFFIFILTLFWHFFLNPHFSLYLYDKINAIISKVCYGFFLKNSFIFFNIIRTKIYCNMDNLKFDNVNVEYDFTF
jgi:hypothetical protein